MDSGIDYNHEDLKDNLWDGSNGCKNEFNKDIVAPNHGWDFLDQDNDPMDEVDDKQHGTAMAGIIAAKGNNNLGIAGLNWDAKLMALRVYDDQEPKSLSVNSIIWAINFAKNNNAKIIVCSLLFYPDLKRIKEAITDFGKAGGLFISCAGNGYEENFLGEDISIRPVYPASWNLDCMITVASTDIYDRLASFSNYSEKLVDISAPGDLLFTTGISKKMPSDFRYQWFQGTCGSISLVGGLASLIWQKNPNLTNSEVKDLIIKYADDIPDLNYKLKNAKRINAFKSLQQVENPNQDTSDIGDQIICYKGVIMRKTNDFTIEIRDFPSRYLEKPITLIFSDNKEKKISALQNAKNEIDYWVNERGYNFGECMDCNK
jgi:subtilisin family serine protease